MQLVSRRVLLRFVSREAAFPRTMQHSPQSLHDALEALRLLANHRLDTKSPLVTVLLGQPKLATKMALGTLAALEQRITVRRPA